MIDCIFPIYVPDQENAVMQEVCFQTFNQTDFPGEVRRIVIDNGSRFGAEDAQKFADIYVRLPTPVGFARAVNIGWKISEALHSETVGVLNNDLTFLDPQWLKTLLVHLDDSACAVAPYDAPQHGITDHIWSSCFFQKQATRQKIGLFDDINLPWRYHDQDYWIRAKRLGLSFKRVGASQVRHKESSTYFKLPQKLMEGREAQIMQDRWGVTMAQHYERPV